LYYRNRNKTLDENAHRDDVYARKEVNQVYQSYSWERKRQHQKSKETDLRGSLFKEKMFFKKI